MIRTAVCGSKKTQGAAGLQRSDSGGEMSCVFGLMCNFGGANLDRGLVGG